MIGTVVLGCFWCVPTFFWYSMCWACLVKFRGAGCHALVGDFLGRPMHLGLERLGDGGDGGDSAIW